MRVFYQSCAHFLEPCAKRIWMLSALFAFLFSGCDSERDKEWKKWRTEISKVDYRCGTIGEYELKINKAYLFHWPVYEGLSDWESKPPPPISCSAKLDMMPIEFYWPGMKPAGKRPFADVISEENDPNYVSVTITAAPNHAPWELAMLLNFRLTPGDDPTESYGAHIKTNFGLYRIEKPYRRSSLSSQTYYWEAGPNNTAITFIDCTLSDNERVHHCRQIQYIPWLGAILEISYQRSQLKNWKLIASDVDDFMKKISTL